jgi:hypothetical protein
LITNDCRGTPSGDIVILVISRAYLTILLVVGQLSSESVAIEYFSSQQPRDVGPLVQVVGPEDADLEGGTAYPAANPKTRQLERKVLSSIERD